MQYWFPNLPTWLTVLVALVVVLAINLMSARAFGEFEFWAALLKVGAIVIFLVVGLVVVIGGFSIGGHKAGFQNLWSNPGGFWPSSGDYNWYGPILVMSGVVFAYAAIEMVGVLPLGPGSKLAVVEFAGQQILISVSRNGVTRLADNSQGDFHAD